MSQRIKASLLIFLFSLCASAILVTHHVRSQLPAPVPHELFRVVEEQLAAVRAADYPSAYRHAASGVQQKFTIPQFESMMRRDYAGMMNAQRVEFGHVTVKGSAAVLQVFFVSESGLIRSFLYSLVAEGDSWKIDGAVEVNVTRGSHRLGGLYI